MWGKKRTAIVVGVIAVAIVIGFVIYYSLFFNFVDYWPPHGLLRAERNANNELTFTIEDWVWGADGPVKFDNCAIHLRINNQSIGPTDYVIDPGPYGFPVRTTHGCGYLNASLFTDGSVFYVIVLNDADSDGNVTRGDTITFIATQPLTPTSEYMIYLITELRSSWSPGYFEGNYMA